MGKYLIRIDTETIYSNESESMVINRDSPDIQLCQLVNILIFVICLIDPGAIWVAQENKVILPTIQKMGNLEELYKFSGGRVEALGDNNQTTGKKEHSLVEEEIKFSGLPVSKQLVESFIDYHTFSKQGLSYGAAPSEAETATARSRLSSLSQSEYSAHPLSGTSRISKRIRSRVSSFADAEFTSSKGQYNKDLTNTT